MFSINDPTSSPNQDGAEDTFPSPRRSGRSRKRPASYNEHKLERELTSISSTSLPKKKIIKLVHNQKDLSQKTTPVTTAVTPTPPEFEVPDDLLEAALAPFEDGDRNKWQGWTEIESEPSFFNVLLKELGVKDVKIQELFAVDEDSLSLLDKPVFGLIFLFQYQDEDRDIEEEDDYDHVWFANQTTENACATVAMLNIVMNSPDIELGDKLREFKADTQDLSPPLCGYSLSTNQFIRSIHNSFARRLDTLNSDLALQNEYDDSKKKKRRGKISVSRKTNKKKVDNEAGYHFVAYVPVDGQVWELDGLENAPICVGPYGDDWTQIAQPFIATRMIDLGDLAFNLLAICRSPIPDIRQQLARNVHDVSALADALADRDHAAPPRTWLHRDDEAGLAEYGLVAADVAGAGAAGGGGAEQGQAEPSSPSLEGLVLRQRQICSEYRAEMGARENDEVRVDGRRQDWTPAIHAWVRKLAEHGVLEELASEVDG